ncbi:putative small monomeric GTPase [Helianthus annuus]|uniref:Putative chloroplast protein import component Toc86/159 n=1 Tax=Helianthus annuus TaxID=4232 RepID=A0A251S941_HELAN|nr:translocase of chloroplast 120, chloroplastic isoform X1 [Helianthus annuus]XP_022011902.1 translocase of chloroplast 120, chloroplastic isoform X1 [Helianthus annuus]XP_022011903.1 translocase of chloroplast 120, chloroplastic isoform X1 [Helianthus annuus]KAF5764405.1 putative small monomeric GTPase [Helianthus annuus]KAJ0455487.1 putative small monomeric GTPase [Helianthus annuus]KAJ0652381.1 putative small monomeric GTPase [Helianthus annuus]
MENGEHKVEDFDKDVVGDGNGGAESVSVTVEVEGSVDGRKDEKEENGGDPVDEGQVVVDENGETETVVEKASVDPVEEVVSLEVNGGERMSDSTTVELPVVIENDKSNEPTDFEEPEVRTNEEGTTSGSTVGNQSSGFEASEATNDGFSETKGIDSVQAIDGESTSDKSAGDETSELETDGGEKDEAKRAGANDEQKIHIDVSRDESDMLENNGVKDNGIKEVGHVSNADVLEDVKDVNKKPVTLVLEASENGVSDHVDSDETVIREDGVNGDSVSCEIQLDGEIGVEANGDVNEKDTLVTESKDDDNVKLKEKFETSNNNLLNVQNGSTVEHVQEEEPKTFDPLSEHQDDKKVKEGSTSAINEKTAIPEVEKSEPENHEVKKDMPEKKEPESSPVIGVSISTHESATPKYDSSSGDQDDKKAKEGSTSAVGEPDSRVERTAIPEVEKSEPENRELKHDMPEKKEPESRPVIGVSLSTHKSATPKHDSNPNQSPGYSSKSNLENHEVKQDMPVKKEPESRPVIGVSLSAPKSATPKHDSNPNQSPIHNSKSHPENHEAKQDMPVKKEPESRPVVGVSLSTSKSATPKHDSKPNQSPIPNSKPTTAPAPVAAPSTTSTRPAGLGSGAPLLEPAHRVVQSQRSGTASLQNQVIEEPTNGEADENDDTREKLQMIRVKFLRLARRLGQTPHNVVVAQVLYRLGLAEQIRGSNAGRVAAFSFERASAMAEQLEAAGQEPLEFSCTIMVLGKTGVGKSATINSIFDEVKFETSAFQHGTKKVQDVVGTVQGIKVRVIDTPGLLPSWADQRKNEKILHSVKRFIQKSPPDIVLYLDRLDMQSRDSGDMPLLRTITDIFGQSIWFNAIVVLTHAASAPPEGANGTATSYDMFVTQRSHVVQQAIRQAAGDMRLMNPVSLVENHSACRTNPAGQRVLPNGQVWKPHLLLLSFASKILVEANMLLKLQDSPPGKPFAARTRAPPLPYILSNLLQSRPQLKLPQEQFGDDDEDGDDDIDESSDEESSEYDELPPFKRLTNSQLSKLSKAQKKAYYDELEYREKLFMKKQLKEEKKRRKMMKKMAEEAKNYPSDITDNNNVEEDSSGAATVPVAVQDMTLPTSFDADNPTHRYRALDTANQWLTRPVLDPHGWDHDVGYEGINVEHLLAVKDKIPVSFSGQITKDKKDANLQMEVSSALKHGKSNSTTVAFDMQTVGKELSYTLRSETRFINYRKNKASAGISATYFGDSLTGGVKFEDKLMINKRGQLVVAGGAVIGRGDVAYGGSLEATLRDKDYPLGRFLSTIGLSVMDWHGDLALGWNAQSQIPIGRFTNLIGRVNLNNKGSGQVSVRLNSSEQLQIALTALVPLVSKLLGYYQDRDSAY